MKMTQRTLLSAMCAILLAPWAARADDPAPAGDAADAGSAPAAVEASAPALAPVPEPTPAPAPAPAPVPAVAPAAPPAPAGPFDLAQTPWGPGRRTSGESFHSMTELLPEGAFRLRGEKWSLGIGGQYLVRGEVRDNADFTTSVEDHSLAIDHRARVTFRAAAFERVGILLEFQDVRGWGTERASNVTEPLTGLHQGFVDVKVASFLDLRLGRQELAYGEERLVGALDWNQNSRAFDGVFMRLSASDKVTVDAFGMMLKPPAFIDYVDPTDGSAKKFHQSGTYFFGAYSRFRLVPAFGFDVYALGLAEDISTVATGMQKDTNLATLGARLVGKAGTRFMAVAEGALQVGGSAQGNVLAGAFALRANYKIQVWGEPYLQLEFLGATGDGDPTDNQVSTFNQLFPTGHAHLGFADLVGWRNTWSFKGTLGFRPWGAHVWLDVHHFRLWDARGAWYNAGGAVFRPGDANRTDDGMGTEFDLSITVPITRYASVAGAYTLFQPGGLAARGRAPSHWAFLYVRTQF